MEWRSPINTVKHAKLYINGTWVDSIGKRVDVINPARKTVIGTIPSASTEEVLSALQAARQAFPQWSSVSASQRGSYLHRVASMIRERAQTLAFLLTSEQGKPVNEAMGEIEKLADIFKYYAEEATRCRGQIIPNDSTAFESLIVYEPVGVVAAISPWNYPVELIGWKVAAGLAAGCTLVVKPPELTPLTPLAIIAVLDDVILPAGVVNMVTGSGATVGQYLIESPLVDKIAFTGSSEVGLHIQRSAKNVKRLSLELGGNCPMIITEKSNLDDAVKGAVRRSFRNGGQICIAINRIYVQRTVYDYFIEKFAVATEALIVDDGLDNPSADLGALCSQEPLDKTLAHLADAIGKGGRLVAGGQPPIGKKFANGFFFRPTIIAECTHRMRVMMEETFGPVVGVAAFDGSADAVAYANDTPYGLAAYLYTKDLDEMRYFSRHLEYGNVAINNVDAGIINAPYGGWKQSGVGVEHGREGMLEYLNSKHIRLCYDESAVT